MVCEHPNCDNESEKRFCSIFCARSYSSIINREKRNKNISAGMKRYISSGGEIFGGKKNRPNPKKISESLKKYYKVNRHKSFKNRSKDELVALNREAVHRSRAKKNGLLPISANIEKIKEIYMNCPVGYEVDHIIPFARGGFHHEDNLQYLTVEENRRKGIK